jgi:hypothetical protein
MSVNSETGVDFILFIIGGIVALFILAFGDRSISGQSIDVARDFCSTHKGLDYVDFPRLGKLSFREAVVHCNDGSDVEHGEILAQENAQ